jgi:hypothetical protein
LLQRTGVRSLAPLGVALALIAHLGFQIPLNVSQQWSALVHDGADTASLDAYLHSSSFRKGVTYRVLRGRDGKLGLYHVLRAGGVIDSELFPEGMAIRSFRDESEYAALLCDRGIDRIIHDDTYDEARRTNEIAMIESLERASAGGVQLRRIAGGVGWQVDAVDRSHCP